MARTKQRTRLQDFLVTPGDEIRGEDATTAGGAGNTIPITAGSNPVVAASGAGGDVILTSGSVTDGGSTGDAGDIVLTPGTAAGAGADGDLIFSYATWPASDGALGNVLTTDGAGGLSWGAASSSGWATVLTVGASSGGTNPVISNGDSIIGVDSAVVSGTGFMVRGGNFTGGAGNFNGGSVFLMGGSSNGSVNGLSAGDVTVQGGSILGSAGGTTRAGIVNILGGDATGGAGAADGGDVLITGGPGNDLPGDVVITGGSTTTADGGDVSINGGAPTAGGGNGGDVTISSGLGEGNGDTGNISILVPTPGGGLVAGGSITVSAGNTLTQNAAGGDVDISAGSSSGSGTARGGDVTLTAGEQTGAGGGRGGSLILTTGDAANASFAAGTVTMTGPNDEGEPLAVLTTTGLNGNSADLFVGSSDPGGVVSGSAASLFFRDTGTGATLYLNTSTGSGTTWSALAVEPTQQYSRVNGDNGYGSSFTNVMRWDTETESNGTDISYSDDFDEGGRWEVNTTGIYSVTLSIQAGAAGSVRAAINVGAGVNNTFNGTYIRSMMEPQPSETNSCSWTGPISAGQAIWASADGGSALTVSTNFNIMTVTRVR